jgi:hypothetical protein
VQDEFLNELRKQFDYEIDIKDKLEAKATNTITVAGIMAAIFMGFGSQISDYVPNNSPYFSPALGVFLIELIVTMATVIISILAYKVGEYQFPLEREDFLSDDGKYNTSRIEQYRKMEDDDYNKLLKKYLKCIKYNAKENEKKATRIVWAQATLILAVVLIPIFAALIVFSQWPVQPSLPLVSGG